MSLRCEALVPAFVLWGWIPVLARGGLPQEGVLAQHRSPHLLLGDARRKVFFAKHKSPLLLLGDFRRKVFFLPGSFPGHPARKLSRNSDHGTWNLEPFGRASYKRAEWSVFARPKWSVLARPSPKGTLNLKPGTRNFSPGVFELDSNPSRTAVNHPIQRTCCSPQYLSRPNKLPSLQGRSRSMPKATGVRSISGGVELDWNRSRTAVTLRFRARWLQATVAPFDDMNRRSKRPKDP